MPQILTIHIRLLRTESLPSGVVPDLGSRLTIPPAIALLDSVDALELELLQTLNPKRNVASLRWVAWDQIGTDVYLPAWRRFVIDSASLLANYTVKHLPDAVAQLNEIAARIRDPPGMLLTREKRIERGAQLLWMALVVVLCDQGWKIHTAPRLLSLECDGCRMAPVEIIAQIRSGAMTTGEWNERCRNAGISELRLAQDTGGPLPPPP